MREGELFEILKRTWWDKLITYLEARIQHEKRCGALKKALKKLQKFERRCYS